MLFNVKVVIFIIFFHVCAYFKILFCASIQDLFGSGYRLFSLGFLGQFCMLVNSAHEGKSIRVNFQELFKHI